MCDNNKLLPDLSRDELDQLGFGCYGVVDILNTYYTLPTGERIALRIWAPKGYLNISEEFVTLIESSQDVDVREKFPAVLEYLPYRKADSTAERDHRRHPWLASHGFVVVRADLRGTGDSDGLYHDEHLQQEMDDCCHLIDWISRQDWCNGNVGMYGKSWGGSNGLQLAYLQPPALKAVISLYSTASQDDIHWKGGCVLGGGMLFWASFMFCWDARAPQPQYNKDWQAAWRNRLERAGESCLRTWLEHQSYDEYWRHGSVCEDYNKIQIPVLLFGGWHDGYTNAAFRLAEKLPNCRTVLGPWSHNWPDTAVPGPNMAYMDECLQFWTEHLKEKEVRLSWSSLPSLRWWQCRGEIPPGPTVSTWPGLWQARDRELTGDILSYSFDDDGHLCVGDATKMKTPVSVSFSGAAGLTCGEWLSFGAADLPGDQRAVAQYHACWQSPVLADELHILGRGEVVLDCQVDTDQAQVYAGLCHVMKNKGGGFRLITYGLLNISGERKQEIRMKLDVIGYTVPPGDSLLLMISPGSFPTSWPASQPTNLTILSGSLHLPLTSIQPPQLDRWFSRPDLQPRLGPAKNVEVIRPDTFTRELTAGLSHNLRSVSTKIDEGCRYYEDVDTLVEENAEYVYTINGDDPLSAEAYYSKNSVMIYQARKGAKPIKTETQTESWMRCDEKYFLLENKLTTRLDDELFWQKTWNDRVERK